MLYYWRISRFEHHKGHIVPYLGFLHKEGKFSLAARVLTQFLKGGKPSFPIFFPCQHFFLDKGAWPNSSPKYATEFSVCHGLGHRRFQDRVECPIDHVEVFHCVEVWFRRDIEPLHLSTEVCSSGLHHSTQSQLSYVWSMVRNHGQEQILRVHEVLVSLNDGIHYLQSQFLCTFEFVLHFAGCDTVTVSPNHIIIILIIILQRHIHSVKSRYISALTQKCVETGYGSAMMFVFFRDGFSVVVVPMPRTCVKVWSLRPSTVFHNSTVCNSLSAGAPLYLLNRLQRVMNEAARMLCRCSRGDHVNRIMKERLHWLRIPQRIQFKLCLLVYKSLHGTAPTYLSELVNQVNTNDARRRLRSATIGDLIVPRTRTNFGQHAFATAGPIAWNSLPKSVRSASSIASFKKKLKTHFFNSI